MPLELYSVCCMCSDCVKDALSLVLFSATDAIGSLSMALIRLAICVCVCVCSRSNAAGTMLLSNAQTRLHHRRYFLSIAEKCM